MRRVKEHACKIGTVSALVVLRGRTVPKVGKRIYYRLASAGAKYQIGLVTQVNSNGFFFMDKL